MLIAGDKIIVCLANIYKILKYVCSTVNFELGHSLQPVGEFYGPQMCR